VNTDPDDLIRISLSVKCFESFETLAYCLNKYAPVKLSQGKV